MSNKSVVESKPDTPPTTEQLLARVPPIVHLHGGSIRTEVKASALTHLQVAPGKANLNEEVKALAQGEAINSLKLRTPATTA